MMEEDEVKPLSSTKRRKRTISSDEEVSPTGLHLRHSERIQKKRSRSFQMPSRDSIWDNIEDSEISPGKLQKLKPRKLINDHLKERNRYNCDRFESSGSESMDDFINDEEEEMSSSSEDNTKPKKQRVRNHYRRMKEEADSGSDSDIKPLSLSDTDSGTFSNTKISGKSTKKKSCYSKKPKSDIQEPASDESAVKTKRSKRVQSIKKDISSESDENLESEETVSQSSDTCKNNCKESNLDEDETVLASARKKTNIIESDSESDNVECEDVEEGEEIQYKHSAENSKTSNTAGAEGKSTKDDDVDESGGEAESEQSCSDTTESSDDNDEFSYVKSSRARKQMKKKARERSLILEKMKKQRQRRNSGVKQTTFIKT